ncbi:protein of unknown function [Cupriavidus neocaledonicus]|uniref:Uncharacterized protein n=1 Tax=Cupriavidus neocaledonicus TaxID=1040979 RepID=A0A375H8Y7_9BURK|nr:protein of unknown function [Cupriavidus neocaledonicus]
MDRFHHWSLEERRMHAAYTNAQMTNL